MNEMLKDSQGHTSSKRIVGVCLVSVGGGLLLALGIIAVFRAITDPGTALSAGQTLVYSGAALLGIGVAEKFAGGKK